MNANAEIKGIKVGWDKYYGYFWGSSALGEPIQTTDKRKIERIKKELANRSGE